MRGVPGVLSRPSSPARAARQAAALESRVGVQGATVAGGASANRFRTEKWDVEASVGGASGGLIGSGVAEEGGEGSGWEGGVFGVAGRLSSGSAAEGGRSVAVSSVVT